MHRIAQQLILGTARRGDVAQGADATDGTLLRAWNGARPEQEPAEGAVAAAQAEFLRETALAAPFRLLDRRQIGAAIGRVHEVDPGLRRAVLEAAATQA